LQDSDEPQGHLSGCFLPQVATETNWSKEEFLSYCCTHKAGLSSDAWREPETEIYLFTADVFGSEFKEIQPVDKEGDLELNSKWGPFALPHLLLLSS
jgi:AMMECR1 domain-containing protein